MKYLSLFSFILIHFAFFAQEKVEWKYSFNQEESTIEIHASIADGWHLYSQHLENEFGPVATSFTFQENPNVIFVGSTQEPKAIHEFDENFETDLNFFKNEVTFSQKIKVKKSTEVNGTTTFMVCNETMCLPPIDKPFTLKVN